MIAHRDPVTVTVEHMDHGLIMLALVTLAMERPEYYVKLFRIARDMNGVAMFEELRDLKLMRKRGTV